MDSMFACLFTCSAHFCEFVCAFLGGRVSQRSPRSSSFPQSQAFSLSSVCACVCLHVCVESGTASSAAGATCVCVLHYKDIRQRLRTVTFPCVRLAATRVCRWKRRETKTHNKVLRGIEGGACPDNSTHLYITKQLKGPRTTSCECVCVFSVNIQSVSPC